MLRCHRVLAPPNLLFYLLILPSHLHSILSSLSPLYHALMSAVFCHSISICSEALIIFLLIVLADIILFLFSSPVGLALLFLHRSFLILTPASLGLWSALCLGFFPVRVPVSSRHPCRFISARIQRFPWISAAAVYCLLAASLPRRLG